MLKAKIEAFVEANSMQAVYEGAVLGFSGGADSATLLHFLKDKTKNLLCVHINHMIRGEEADRDELFAKSTCEKYGVKFVSYKINVPKIAKERKIGIEECARDERYRVFNEILDKNPEYKCIVTAHNLDDNTETVLFNLTRGTGTRGLIGIQARQGKIIRPLLTSSKKEIIEYCLANNIEYVVDSTNSDTKYTRNSIRHNVIPYLKEINPSLNESIMRLGDIISSDEKYFDKLVDKIISENDIKDKIDLALARELDASIISRLLKKVSPQRLDYLDVASSIELLKNARVGSLVNLSGGISFKIERGYAHFIKTCELDEKDFYLALENGVNFLDSQDMAITVNSDLNSEEYTLFCEIKLNREKIDKPIYVRQKRDGDTIKSGKMTKKLKKLFVDAHIPSHLRKKIPLVCMDGEIIAVPSVAIRDGFKGNDYIIAIYLRRK